MESSQHESTDYSHDEALILPLDAEEGLSSCDMIAECCEVVQWLTDRYARKGQKRKDRQVVFGGMEEVDDFVVTARAHPEDDTQEYIRPVSRAPYVPLVGESETEKLAALAAFDTKGDAKRKKKTLFERKASRLLTAVKKREHFVNPSFRILTHQLPYTWGFKSRPVTQERGLTGSLLSATDKMLKHPLYPVSAKEPVRQAIDLGDFTEHDPDTLPERFLEYIHERTEYFDSDTDVHYQKAVGVMHRIWRNAGVDAKARRFADVSPDTLDAIFTSGNAGEYRLNGVTSRRDPRVLGMLTDHIRRFGQLGPGLVRGRPVPEWVNTLDHINTSFGKKEAKAAKYRDGERIKPVPRFIFNPSPCQYSAGAFLHSDISKQLQKLDPTHGPGFGPGRGHARKFLRIVERHMGTGDELPPGVLAIMSDIEKWDANMSEALLSTSFWALESFVDVSDLSPDDRAARRAMCGYIERGLREKIVEHPAGYLVKLYGCMPSGSFYTSLLNTIGNDLLALAMLFERAHKLGKELDPDKVAELAAHCLISYGDNQLIINKLFTEFGFDYDVDHHADFLRRAGMKLKVDETEVTNRLSRIRFCSRGVLWTPAGLVVTRQHDSVVAKLAGRPTINELDDKLYVRAMMCDYMGVDPVIHQMLDDVDRTIHVTIDAVEATKKHRATIESAAMHIYNRKDNDAIAATAYLMSSERMSRSMLLELISPKTSEEPEEVRKRGERQAKHRGRLRSSLTVGYRHRDPVLSEVGQWLDSQTPDSFLEYIDVTRQTGIIA
nr:MAG: RNA-dependent RNA polymerase [Aspergillus flavus polymycovirus 1]